MHVNQLVFHAEGGAMALGLVGRRAYPMGGRPRWPCCCRGTTLRSIRRWRSRLRDGAVPMGGPFAKR